MELWQTVVLAVCGLILSYAAVQFSRGLLLLNHRRVNRE